MMSGVHDRPLPLPPPASPALSRSLPPLSVLFCSPLSLHLRTIRFVVSYGLSHTRHPTTIGVL